MTFPVGATAHLVASGVALADVVDLDGPDAHHLGRVRRIRPGETVTIADGRGSWRRYCVDEVAGGAIHLRAAGDAAFEPVLQPRVAVAFCLTKGDKPETVVEKLTELGVDRILPVTSRRSVVRWDERKAVAAHERLCTIARAAAGQARRARLPEVVPLAPLASIAGNPHVVVADPTAGPGAARIELPEAGEVTVVVGPEGGFDQGEVEALRPWRRLAVAPTILRAETAAIVVAGVVIAARWAQNPC